MAMEDMHMDMDMDEMDVDMDDGDEGDGMNGGDRSQEPGKTAKRIVVVTGGTGGLGRWIVRRFSADGNAVHVPVRDGSRGLAPWRALPEGAGDGEEDVTLHRCDVTEPAEVEDFFRWVFREEGRLDILVNGVGGFTMAPVTGTEPEDWRRMMEVNATSAFHCSRSAAGFMKEAGWGRIVNVASMPALERGAPGMAAYGAAKSALVHFTYSLAEELVEDGVTVNAVVPTVIDTPANRTAMPDASRERWLHPREIADVVAFLAGDAAEIVTGAAIPLSRG